MSTTSTFESRTANLTCTTGEFFDFITDMRNFHQFIPAGTAKEWETTRDNCRLNVAPIGNITIWIGNRVPYTEVLFSGNSSQIPEFSLHTFISEGENGRAVIRMKLDADLNPFIKLIAAGPLEQLMETLVREMENFREWVPKK